MRTVLSVLALSLCLFGQTTQQNTPTAAIMLTGGANQFVFPANPEWHSSTFRALTSCGESWYLTAPCDSWSVELPPNPPGPPCLPPPFGCTYPQVVVWVTGVQAAGQVGELWAHVGPPLFPGASSVGGVWHLDLGAQAKVIDISFGGAAGPAAWSHIFLIEPGWTFDVTLQGWVSDPASPFGATLTGFGEVWR